MPKGRKRSEKKKVAKAAKIDDIKGIILAKIFLKLNKKIVYSSQAVASWNMPIINARTIRANNKRRTPSLQGEIA